MSMIGNFHRASDAEIEHLLAHPEEIGAFLHHDDDEVASPALDAEGDMPHDLDIDKAWHGLHFLLTGSEGEADPPLNFIPSGGTPVGDVDMGYGPGRAFTSAEVRQIAAALEGITGDTLRARYDPERMDALQVYPLMWARDGEDGLAYLLDSFRSLKQYVQALANGGFGMVAYLS